MKQYDVALSFAGEDRTYVEAVAKRLQDLGVKVFYDSFEETKLWGKNLYSYLSDVYQNQAYFTVMFISEAYKNKLWTNHEREAAQARAFAENKEYILPAFFNTAVDVPGVLKTTVYISLASLTPVDFADKIADKLKKSGVPIGPTAYFHYSDVAKADVDFPIYPGSEVSDIVSAMKSYNWYTQSPAIDRIFTLDWSKRTADEAFVLGRNIYQCAVGTERAATAVMNDLRRSLARLPGEWAEHVLNGMFYEVYFNHEGTFRGRALKGAFIDKLFALEAVARFEKCIEFMRHSLGPYRTSLGVLPNKVPESLLFTVLVDAKDPPEVTSILCNGNEQLIAVDGTSHDPAWRISYRGFVLGGLQKELKDYWSLPEGHFHVTFNTSLPTTTVVKLPAGKSLGALRA